jgi:hypothetical protein
MGLPVYASISLQEAGIKLIVGFLCYGNYDQLYLTREIRLIPLTILGTGRRGILMMSSPWVHKKISLRFSIVAICVAVVVTIACLQTGLSFYESKINGDTPAICRLYLEQSALVHDHFGAVQEELFVKDESATIIQDQGSGTIGLYTFKVSGTKAKGTLKMVWAREVGNGALTVTAISITDEHPLSHPLTDHRPKEAAPQLSGLPNGPLAIVL